MYEVFVIDTSVLMDLERGLLITEIFLLPFIFPRSPLKEVKTVF